MAEAIIVNVAAKIIESLGSQALKEIGLLWGVKDELEKLQNTFSTIQAVLRDAEEQSAVNLQVRDWLEKLKDVAYDADDLLDGFSTVHLLREMMTRDKMAKKMGDISGQLPTQVLATSKSSTWKKQNSKSSSRYQLISLELWSKGII
ncbi:hypothetical protein CIPAW_13G157700 [Carya illinoinensis]|uniref:Disease resistance N-terminal domain-containing protein n=1 Tax=Carya illinoinensis TaxID=32201 RepID=A0A8T1NSG7_CARIL|nr:hypothetical protein CIPAW_13G157700 [Carya illinoinensis]